MTRMNMRVTEDGVGVRAARQKQEEMV